MLKRINIYWKLLFLFFISIFVVVFILGLRLSKGPINISFLSPYLSQIIELTGQNLDFTYGKANIQIDKLASGIKLEITDFSFTQEHNIIKQLEAKSLKVRIKLTSLFKNRFYPEYIELTGVNLIAQNNSASLFSKNNLTSEKFSTANYWSKLKNISFKNSSIRVFNSTKEEHIFLKDLSGDFLIDKGEILAKASLVNYKTGKTSLELFSPKIDIGGLFHDDNIRISSEKLVIDSDLMNKFYPIFKNGIKINLKKTNFILSQVNFEQFIKFSSKLNTEKGEIKINSELYHGRDGIKNGKVDLTILDINPQKDLIFINSLDYNGYSFKENLDVHFDGKVSLKLTDGLVAMAELHLNSREGKINIPFYKTNNLEELEVSSSQIELRLVKDKIEIPNLKFNLKNNAKVALYGEIMGLNEEPDYNIMLVLENSNLKNLSYFYENMLDKKNVDLINSSVNEGLISSMILEIYKDSNDPSKSLLRTLKGSIRNISINKDIFNFTIPEMKVDYSVGTLNILADEAFYFTKNTKGLKFKEINIDGKNINLENKSTFKINGSAHFDGKYFDMINVYKLLKKEIDYDEGILEKFDGTINAKLDFSTELDANKTNNLSDYGWSVRGEFIDFHSIKNINI